MSRPVLDFFHSADHTVANVEGALIDAADDGSRGVFFHSMNPAATCVLERIGADIWSIGNNHTMDAGREGVISTRKIAQETHFLAEKLGMEYDGASLGIAMEDEVSGALTNNFGVLLGDAGFIEVRLNYRYPVTKSFDMCGPQVQAAFEAAGFRCTASIHKNCLYMPEDSELVRRLMKVYRDCTGDTASAPKSIGGGTYAKMLPNVLAFGPIFPGDEVREHKPDEFMVISRLLDNANILAEAMYALAAQ